MRPRFWAIVIGGLGIAAGAGAGDLWLACPSGLEISVDGEYVGVCRADLETTHIAGLSDGTHQVRIGEDAGTAHEFAVSVGTVPHQVVVAARSPSDGGPRETGNIQIVSDPLECTVKVGDLWADKQQPVLSLQGLPAGEHRVWFERYGQILQTDVAVEPGETLRLKANFTANAVTNLDEHANETADTARPVAAPVDDGCVVYWLEVLRTSDPARVEEIQEMLDELGFPPYHQKLITIDDDGVIPLYKLRVGPIESMHLAKYSKHKIRPTGLLGMRILAEPCAAAQAGRSAIQEDQPPETPP